MVIKAVGQQKQGGWISRLFPELELSRNGTVVRDSQTGGTNLPHVFTGGDCANGGREVVNAVGEGKKAARGIHAYFGLTSKAGPVQPSRWGVPHGPFGSGLDYPDSRSRAGSEIRTTLPRLASRARHHRAHFEKPAIA